MKTSIASLKERLADWIDWDLAMYQLGVCLGFWPDFGAPHDNDPWHGTKHIFWSANILGDALDGFVVSLIGVGCLEADDEYLKVRWNPNYIGDADLTSLLE